MIKTYQNIKTTQIKILKTKTEKTDSMEMRSSYPANHLQRWAPPSIIWIFSI